MQLKQQRRWLRFDLRSFFFVSMLSVLIGLCVCAGVYVLRAEKQRAFVRWVKENNRIARYEKPHDDGREKYLNVFLDINYYSNVYGAEFERSDVVDLSPLFGQTNLKVLKLRTQVRDLTRVIKKSKTAIVGFFSIPAGFYRTSVFCTWTLDFCRCAISF